jgi:hypothetical protein
MESEWNYNVDEAPRWRIAWLSIESDSGENFVTLGRARSRADRVYAWKPYEIPEPTEPAPMKAKRLRLQRSSK